MSISQTTPEETTSGHGFCPHCNAALPERATFCSSCGERVAREKQTSILLEEQDSNNYYRITTLVRRRSYINLYFALDNHPPVGGQPRMVAIRDIEVANLKKETRDQVITLVQQEYDNLRRWQIPHMLTSIDLRSFQGHLFLISGMPFTSEEIKKAESAQRLYTLQDFLQSGQGLPKEARALEWIRNLGQAVEQLHRRGIVLGDLDPYTVVLNKNSVIAEPRLMISWLLSDVQKLLPASPNLATPQVSYFSGPEALRGEPEVRSDVYSLGALLYLLLTGTPPDESTLRHRRRLPTPREVNSRISQHLDECVMHALAIEAEGRFATVSALITALQEEHPRQSARQTSRGSSKTPSVPLVDAETVRIVPLSQKDVARWRVAKTEVGKAQRSDVATLSTQVMPSLDTLSPVQNGPDTGPPLEGSKQIDEKLPLSTRNRRSRNSVPGVLAAQVPDWKTRITGILPAIKPESGKVETADKPTVKTGKAVKSKERKAKAKVKADKVERQQKQARSTENGSDLSFLKQLQRLILGEQQHAVETAAIIETPMRVRPDQPYNLRLHVMGRDQPTSPESSRTSTGLSSLFHGEAIQIEVRTALQQGYTYVLQQATVTIPASGYAAEVTIPMQPQAGTSAGRRDRLHVFFLDEQHHPIYEKPFAVEVFVSPLVQFGREGHQVLTIPL